MEYFPIKTRIVQPPKDDMYAVFDEYLTVVCEGDIVFVTSKIVAIHQGQCVLVGEIEKQTLVEQEAEYLLKSTGSEIASQLTIMHNALFYGAGIDESNADGHYILLPSKPFDMAYAIWKYVKEKHSLQNVGVVITDSHSSPMRTGAMGIAIAWWGFHPTESHKQKKDLFGRELQFSVTNIVDALAAGATVVCGETDESTPIVIARNIPKIIFTQEDTRDELFTQVEEDIYYPLLKAFYN